MTTHLTFADLERRMHANSVKAYAEGRAVLNERSRAVLSIYRLTRRQMTDRECMCIMHFTDPNAVRPRITELIDAGLLVECGKTKDAITGKTVRLVRAP